MKTKILNKISTPVFAILALILFGAAITFAQTPTLRANGKIAFTGDRAGNMEIYVMNNDGTGQVRLTNNAARDYLPAFSPDGQPIARTRISITDTNGETRTTLTSSFGYYRFETVEVGQIYVVDVHSKRFQFTPQVISVTEEIKELNFIAER